MIFCTKHGCLSLLGLLSENSTDLGAQTTDTYFSQSGGWSPGSSCLLTWSLVRPFPWLGDVCLLSVATCSERREVGRERGGRRERQNELPDVCSYKHTNPIVGTTPRTSSRPRHLPKPHTSPNTITLEVRVSTHGFVGDTFCP